MFAIVPAEATTAPPCVAPCTPDPCDNIIACEVYECEDVRLLQQAGVCAWLDGLPDQIRDCLTTYGWGLGPCVPQCSVNDIGACPDEVCDKAVALGPGGMECAIGDPCQQWINCDFPTVCSDHLSGWQDCGPNGYTCVRQEYATLTCVQAGNNCVGALQGIGMTGIVLRVCVEKAPTCVDVDAGSGWSDIGPEVCTDNGATCVWPLGNSVASFGPACVIVRDDCVVVQDGSGWIHMEPICVYDEDDDDIPDDVERALCGRAAVRDAINRAGEAGRCDAPDNFTKKVHSASVFVPSGYIYTQDADGDGVLDFVTLAGRTTTVDSEGNVQSTSDSRGPYQIDPDASDRNNPVPRDTIDDTVNWLVDEVEGIYNDVDGDGDGVADAAEPWMCQIEDQNTNLDGHCSADMQDYTPPV